MGTVLFYQMNKQTLLALKRVKRNEEINRRETKRQFDNVSFI